MKISLLLTRFVIQSISRWISYYSSQIGEVEGSKPEPAVGESGEVSGENGEAVPLDKVVIKKREKKDDRKSTEGKDLGEW